MWFILGTSDIFECGNERFASVKCREYFEYQSDSASQGGLCAVELVTAATEFLMGCSSLCISYVRFELLYSQFYFLCHSHCVLW